MKLHAAAPLRNNMLFATLQSRIHKLSVPRDYGGAIAEVNVKNRQFTARK